MFLVRTLVPDYTGEVGGVAFVNGEAVVAPGPALSYFRSAGYHIEPAPDAADPAVEVFTPGGSHETATAVTGQTTAVVERPRGNASTEAWRAYAVAKGMPADEAETLGRNEIAARYPEENPS